MTEAAFLAALLRAGPLCLVLPLPGLAARAALAIVLAAAAMGAPGLDGAVALRELGRGVALGLGVAVPLYAARWAGGLIGGRAAARRPGTPELVAGALGWVIFAAAGGLALLVTAFVHSYARWPVGAVTRLDADALGALARAGGELIALSARLALPALLVLALVELAAGLLGRFERGAVFEPGAVHVARTARPLLVVILLGASVAAFTHGVGGAILDAARLERAPTR